MSDLASIRDEIGDPTPPDDATLTGWLTELGDWRLVAVRVLKRRRSALLTGTGEVTIPDVITYKSGGNLAAYDAQIARLEAAAGLDGEASGAATSTLLRRVTPR